MKVIDTILFTYTNITRKFLPKGVQLRLNWDISSIVEWQDATDVQRVPKNQYKSHLSHGRTWSSLLFSSLAKREILNLILQVFNYY